MTIIFIASIALFVLSAFLDYRSSLGDYREANPLVRGKDGRISKVKFFLYVGVAVGAAIVALIADNLLIGAIIMGVGAALHFYAVVHNKKIK